MLSAEVGEGAVLRGLEPWLAGEFAEYVERSREHLAPWLPWAVTVVDEESARGFLRTYADRQATDTGRIYGIWLDEKLVGGTLFRVFDVASGLAEIGVWIAPEAQGRGLITRASRLMIDWAFRVRGMHRIEWRCVTANTRSAAVARRLGMSRDGVMRQMVPRDGVRQDMEIWSLLAPEWPGLDGELAVG